MRVFNISYRRNGALRFLKIGRLSVSWSIARAYRPVKPALPLWQVRAERREAARFAAYVRELEAAVNAAEAAEFDAFDLARAYPLAGR